MITVLFAAFTISFAFSTTSADESTSFHPTPNVATTKKLSSWMSRLPNEVELSRLSLPGTHDSCALHDGLSFGFAKCQTWPLAAQLEAGIRFVDIRCRHVNNRFLIYHGIIDQRMTFKDVRDVCQKFLKSHPTECIVMSVKEESSSKNATRSFADTFSEAIKNDGDLWHISRKTPLLKTVRKRIVLIDRVGTLGGLHWNDMDRQDQYEAPLKLKTKLIRAQLNKAGQSAEPIWFINFCSGTLPTNLITPTQYATQSNKTALEFLNKLELMKRTRLGVVACDFPSELLVQRIVETNFATKESN